MTAKKDAAKLAQVAPLVAANGYKALALADALRLVHEAQQTLAAANGYKALVRRFGDLLQTHFGVERLALAAIGPRPKKPTLKRRPVRFAVDLTQYDEAELAALGGALAAADFPLTELRDGSGRFTHGGHDYNLAVLDDPEAAGGSLLVWEMPPTPTRPLAAQADAAALLDMLVRQLQSECRWYRRLDKTQAMLYRDDLTGLFNHRYLELALDQELARASRFQSQFCLLFIDLDGFKPINDQHGHLAGSAILKQVADVIRDAVREIDVPIRYGGDEFVVVLLGATCAKGMLAAERIRKRIEQKEFSVDGGGAARLTASIGIAAFPEHARDREALLKLADETMYDSKRGGKNRVTVVGQAQSAGAAEAKPRPVS